MLEDFVKCNVMWVSIDLNQTFRLSPIGTFTVNVQKIKC